MRRWSCWLVAPAFLFACGCFGQVSYEKRLDHTLKLLERNRTIAKNLSPAPAGDKKFTDLAIYVRPPKDETLNKTGQLPVAEGQFDLDASFVDKTDSVLHLLARVKLPKKAPAKGQPAPAAPVARGDFTKDVLEVLTGVFGPVDAFATPKFVPETKMKKRFNRLIAAVNDKEVRVYTYKEGSHEVALVFVYDPKLKATIGKKIDLCLEEFATGPKANRSYSGNADEEDDAAPGGGGGGAGAGTAM